MRFVLLAFLVALTAHANPEEIRPNWMPSVQPRAERSEARCLRGGCAAEDAGVIDAPPRRWGLFATGATLFVAGYVADIGVSYGMNHANPEISLIPVIGPLIQLGDTYQIANPNSVKTGNPTIDQQSSQMIATGNQAYSSLVYTGLVLDAALQIAGVVTAIVGASTHTRRNVRVLSNRLSISF